MDQSSQPRGPFGSDREASAASEWSRSGRPPGRMAALNYRDLLTAVKDAGLELGAYDDRVLRWLAGFEPAATMAVAGLIARGRPPAGVDSEAWACGGCGAQMIGGRLANSRCRDCTQ